MFLSLAIFLIPTCRCNRHSRAQNIARIGSYVKSELRSIIRYLVLPDRSEQPKSQMSQPKSGKRYVQRLPIPLWIAIPVFLMILPVIAYDGVMRRVKESKRKRERRRDARKQVEKKEVDLSAFDSETIKL